MSEMTPLPEASPRYRGARSPDGAAGGLVGRDRLCAGPRDGGPGARPRLSCGAQNGPGGRKPGRHQRRDPRDYFEPKVITVTVGSVVRWTNLGQRVHFRTSENPHWN